MEISEELVRSIFNVRISRLADFQFTSGDGVRMICIRQAAARVTIYKFPVIVTGEYAEKGPDGMAYGGYYSAHPVGDSSVVLHIPQSELYVAEDTEGPETQKLELRLEPATPY